MTETRPLSAFITPFAWTTIAFNTIATILSLYVWFIKTGMNVRRFQHDFHYRLRVVLCGMLFLNRLSQFIPLWFVYRMLALDEAMALNKVDLGNEQWAREYKLLYQGRYYCRLLQSCTLYIMMSLTLFLTLDRYRRVFMLLPGMRLYRFLYAVCLVVVVFLVYICIGFAVDYIPKSLVYNYYRVPGTAEHYFIMSRQLMEGCLLVVGAGMYYAFTIRLIYKSIEASASLDEGGTETIACSPNPPHQDPMTIHHERRVIRYQTLQAAFKMLGLFLLLICVDIFVFLSFVLQTLKIVKLNDYDYDHQQSLAGAWLVVHVWTVFYLLDMFLRDLRRARIVERVEPAADGQRVWRKKRGYRDIFSSKDSTPADHANTSFFTEYSLNNQMTLLSSRQGTQTDPSMIKFIPSGHSSSESGKESKILFESRLESS